MLRTRSPLDLSRCCHRSDLVRLACVKHAASVRPEPGSNSPSRPRLAGRAHQRRSESRPLRADWHNCFPRQNRGVCGIDMRSRSQLLGHRSPALAFVRPLFRFQGATQTRGTRLSRGGGAALWRITYGSGLSSPTGTYRTGVSRTMAVGPTQGGPWLRIGGAQSGFT